MVESKPAESERSDALTIGAIAVFAYVLASVLHEGLGHGGACYITGGRVKLISTVAADCSADNRLVIAGGTLMNAATAIVCFALMRITRPQAVRLRFFFWLTMAVSLYTAAGYFLFSGIGGFGDWAEFIKGFQPQWAWRAGMTILGAAAYWLSARFVLLELRPLIGSDKERVVRAAKLSKISYFTGGILACIAGALNPNGFILVALSAAASTFGGTSGLLWTLDWLKGDRIPRGSFEGPEPIRRSWACVAAAAVLAAFFIGFIGPGVHFH